VWIIDPLDGTREYGEGRADWAVHVALWQDGELEPYLAPALLSRLITNVKGTKAGAFVGSEYDTQSVDWLSFHAAELSD